jgi:Flp pilus assembly protein TadD
VLEKAGKDREAGALWDEAVAAVPGHTGILLEAARSHARRGDAYGAALLYERLLRLAPDDPVAMQERAALGAVRSPGDGAPAGTPP